MPLFRLPCLAATALVCLPVSGSRLKPQRWVFSYAYLHQARSPLHYPSSLWVGMGPGTTTIHGTFHSSGSRCPASFNLAGHAAATTASRLPPPPNLTPARRRLVSGTLPPACLPSLLHNNQACLPAIRRLPPVEGPPLTSPTHAPPSPHLAKTGTVRALLGRYSHWSEVAQVGGTLLSYPSHGTHHHLPHSSTPHTHTHSLWWECYHMILAATFILPYCCCTPHTPPPQLCLCAMGVPSYGLHSPYILPTITHCLTFCHTLLDFRLLPRFCIRLDALHTHHRYLRRVVCDLHAAPHPSDWRLRACT